MRLLIRERRHRRWWLPSYFCQDVVRSIAATGIGLRVYPDTPLLRQLDLSELPVEPGDAMLIANTFGLRDRGSVLLPPPREGVDIVEDHTHDPTSAWAWTSRADYCLASLRKLYPLPDGGVLWSPTNRPLPSPPETEPALRYASHDKLSGMILKTLFLEGHAVEKAVFRNLLAAGEQNLLGSAISGITDLSRTLLSLFPLKDWCEQRGRNFRMLCSHLRADIRCRVLCPQTEVPFSAVFVLDDPEQRTEAHRALIRRNVYASILWPMDSYILEDVPEEHVELSRRTFSIPIDARYTETDMERTAVCINEAFSW